MLNKPLKVAILAAILAVPAMLATALIAPGKAAAQSLAVVVTDLNVRTGPGTGYPRLTTLPGGATVQVFTCTPDNWCDIAWNQVRGWVSGAYLNGYGAPVYGAAPPPAAVYPPYPAIGLGIGLGLGLGYGPGYYGPGWRPYDRRGDHYRPRHDHHNRPRRDPRPGPSANGSRFNPSMPCPPNSSCEFRQQ
jgi:uncharacterized protein YraI